MTDQPELDLSPPVRSPAATRSRTGLYIAALLFAAGGGLAAWKLLPSREVPAATTTDEPPAVAAAEPTPVEEPELAPAEVEAAKKLPSLGESDSLVRDWAARMSGAPELARWIAEPHLLQRFMAVVSLLGEGKSPRALLGVLTPVGAFTVREDGERVFVDPASFTRYDGVGTARATLDIAQTSAAYRVLRPLIVGAWQQVAPPGKRFHTALDEAIRPLLAVSVPAGDIELVPKGALYAYADPELEALTPAQKHLVRMGPENAAKVQKALEQLGAALGLPGAR